MEPLDDLTLDRGSGTPPPVRVSKASPAVLVGMALAGLLVGALGSYWWAGRRLDPGQSVLPVNGASSAVVPGGPSPRTLPPLAQMDTFLRALLGTVSAHPDLARWLATDGLLQQLASGIDQASRGQTMAKELPMFRPTRAFEITERGRTMTIDPASYRRYDGLATFITSLDAEAVAQAYWTVHPRLDEAFRGLGRGGQQVDPALTAAFDLLLATPVIQDPLRLTTGAGANFAYLDPKLEALSPIQKQLLRMGPDNVAKIQDRIKAIQTAVNSTRP